MQDGARQLQPGDVFAGYRIELLVGRGGMGLVYRARELRPARTVALKVIMPTLAADGDFRGRFEQEAALAAQIEHPNVIPIYAVGEEEGLLYIVMRFVESMDLARHLRAHERFASRRAARFVTQIAAALDAAHARGLVHRDVKPANVLVTGAVPEEHLYLTDFGLTKRVADVGRGLTTTGGFVGTLDYIAPEQVSDGVVDGRADVYALGCVLYQLLTGVVPFPRDQEVAKIFAHLNLPPPRASDRAPGVSPEVDAVVLRAMAKEPADRFQSAGELARMAVAAANAPDRHVGDHRDRVEPGTSDQTVVGADVTEVVGSGSARESRGPRVFSVPVMTRAFVGREASLERLATGFVRAGMTGTQIQAIHGMGGVGKTQLAARYAREYHDSYDVVWWLRADHAQSLRTDMGRLAVALGLIDPSESDLGAAMMLARGWLEESPRWLLVFDDAPGPEAVAYALPEGVDGHVLITSRVHADWRALRATPVALHVWEREESLAFLAERTGEPDVVALDVVAAALEDLPLALEQAAAYANKQAITMAVYAQRLNQRAPELLAAGQPPSYAHTVANTWSLAFDEVGRHSVARGLLEACAYLAPERIPRELLEASVGDLRDSTGARESVDAAIELLLSYGLLIAGEAQTVSMHRLVQELARWRQDDATRQRAAACAVALLDRVFPAEPRWPEHWPASERLRTHALIAAGHAEMLKAAPALTASVLVRLGEYQLVRAEPSSAMDLSARALAIFEAVHGPRHATVARAAGNLGSALERLGDRSAARRALERALEISEEVHGPNHPEVASVLVNLGTVLAHLGDLAAARTAGERALAIEEELYGGDHPEVAVTLTNLGRTLESLGDLPAARAAQERALAINQRSFGPEHPHVGLTLTNLGNVMRKLGDLQSAYAAQQRALIIAEQAYGPGNPEVAETLVNLGLVLQDLDDVPAAVDAQERAVAILEGIYGPRHPELATALTRLSDLEAQVGDAPAAHAAKERAEQIRSSVPDA